MANDSTFTFELGVMQGRIKELDAKLHTGITAAMDETGTAATAYMKTSAPWTDRTGAARAGLHSDNEVAGNSWTLTLAHAVSYGIWLEIANNGRYQIIMPSIRWAMDRMGHHLSGMMGDLR